MLSLITHSILPSASFADDFLLELIFDNNNTTYWKLLSPEAFKGLDVEGSFKRNTKNQELRVQALEWCLIAMEIGNKKECRIWTTYEGLVFAWIEPIPAVVGGQFTGGLHLHQLSDRIKCGLQY